MKKILLFILFFCCSVLAFGQYNSTNNGDESWENTEYNTTEGQDFWLTFMRNSGSSGQDNKDMFLYVYATSRKNAQVTITNPFQSETKTFNVRAGKQDSCLIPNNWVYIEDDKQISNFGIHVTSTEPIALYATNQHSSGKYDATNVLPTNSLMGEYVIQTYRIDQYSTEFAIVATQTQTVTIHLKKTTIDIQEYETNGKVRVVSTDQEIITLNMKPGQTYLYRSASDDGGVSTNRATSLSGTTICSEKPVAVFMGGQSAKVPSDPENHIFSQAYPTDKWGKTFIVTPTYGMVYDYVQFTACKSNTQIRRNGTLIATINAGESYIDTIKSSLYYASTGDLMTNNLTYSPNVVQYTTSQVAECFLFATSNTANHPSFEGLERQNMTTQFGAPTLTPVIPQELAMKSTMLATFTKPYTKTYLQHYVNIVTPTSEVSGMRMDGASIATHFKQVPNSSYSYAIIQVSPQAHFLENARGNVNSTFTARVYGMGQSSSSKESYAYAVGSRLDRKADLLIDNQYIKEKTICISQDISFTGLAEGEYSSVSWDFGDNTQATKLSSTHTFTKAGDYDVVFTVKRPYPYICSHASGLGQNGYVLDKVHATIHVREKYTADFHHKICEGESVTLTGRDEDGNIRAFTYSSDTQETKHFYTIEGCDSIVDVNIKVGRPVTKFLSETACESYTWHGKTYTESDKYTWVGKTEYGCDSTVILDLTILKPVTGPMTEITICANSTYDWNGQHITKEDTYTAHLTAANGCDSVAKLKVNVENEYKEELSKKLCYGESYEWRGKVLTEAKTYTETSPSPLGCDSTFILHLSFYPDYSNMQQSATTCADHPYSFGDEELTESGTYTKAFISVGGCDSIVTLQLNVLPLEYDTICESICTGERYYFNGRYLTTGDEYKMTEKNSQGCTKTTVLYLTVNPPTHKYDTVRICDKAMPYTYAGKYVASNPGDYQQTLDVKNQYGCDSIYHLHLIVDKSIITQVTISRCDYDGPYNHQDQRMTRLQNLTETGVYRDTLDAVNGCDSIVELHLTVGERTYHTMPVTLCDDELPWTDPNNPTLQLYRDTTYNDTIPNTLGCDSVITVILKVYQTYTLTMDTVICQSEAPYNHPDNRFTNFRNLSSTTTVTQTVQSIHGCDSTVTLQLVVNPVTYIHRYENICEEALPYTYGDHGKKAYSEGEYRDTLTTKNQYGCDSVLVLHLTVMETIIDRQKVVLCDNELPYNHPDMRATKLQNLTLSNVYRDTLTTINGCDSILELQLQVWQTYTHNQYDTICDDGSFNFHGHIFEHLAAKDTPYTFDTILTSVHGCDSLVHFFLTVYPTYRIPSEIKTICQNTDNPNWEWRDEDGTLHGIVSIAEAREVFFADTLPTIHGCDSIFGLQLRIIPSYRFDSLYNICQDERVEWQGRSYCGDRAVAQVGDKVLEPGLYMDTVKRQTIEGCDSIFYLQLHVYPIYDTDVYKAVCDNEDAHTFNLFDTQGTFIQDELPFAPTPSVEKETKETVYIDRDYYLKTVHGCDSVVHLHLTVHPTYEFVTKAEICWNQKFLWRGKEYSKSGVYTDSISADTIDGQPILGTHYWHCDSVYVLELYKRPVKRFDMPYDTICDTETYYHRDTVWYDEDRFSANEYILWRPGEARGDTMQFIVPTFDGVCDSIIYNYHLTINKSYRYYDTAYICSNVPYIIDTHIYTGHEKEYEPDEYVLPYDTLIIDRYNSIHGCDSVYKLTATIYPAYRHIDYITICDDGEADWRAHHYEGSMIGNTFGSGLPAGQYTFYDSLTTIHNCDSIYELRLTVTPTYLFEETVTKCADDDMTWHGHILDHLPVGDYFFYDSTTTVIYGCDSVYHLYLTVKDTTFEVRYDTICRTESYNLHGVYLMEPGSYKDTTFNDWGCHHFTYLHLEVIEPTVPTAWADSICADDDAYELFYRYTGRDPIAFSLYYNDFGHQYGFEDQIDIPITTTEELAVLTIPMPFRDDDKRKYPRPDHYPVKLVLDNGICTNPDLCSTDTSIVLNYPSWVTEQRFRDVIAILSEKYNGGYTFSHYQWYRNGEPIPGEALPYLYIPRELDRDTVEYYVRLIREGETESYQTCPIRIYDDFGTDTIAPYMGYLSVVPTCVSTGNPVISILSRHKGTYNIGSVTGKLITSGSFTPDVTEVRLPAQEGIYIVHLWSDETPEEPERTIKVQVVSGDRLW